MEYIISLSSQTRGFLFALGLGAVLGVIYDVIRIFRLTFTRSGLSVLTGDIVFMLVSCALTFLYCLTATDGEVRLYVLAGELLGFAVYYFSFGIIAVRFCEKTACRIRSFFKKLLAFIFAPAVRFFRFLKGKMRIFLKFLHKMSKKCSKNAKMHLQKDKALLYNQIDKMQKYRKKSSENEGEKKYGDKEKEKS